jgi:hypothetical protein
MSGQNPAFRIEASVSISASSTTANGALGGKQDSAVVTNLTTGNAYVTFGGVNTVAATAGTGYLVAANTQRTVYCGPTSSYVAVILDTSSGTVYVERGDGSAR